MSDRPVRDIYMVTEMDMADPNTAAMVLNILLNLINDRLDRLEGTRGTSTVQAPMQIVDSDGNIVGGHTGGTSV